jgi:hypothetical protein
MGIEPTRKVVPDLENKQFGAIMNAKCDGRVNFRGMWGHVRTRAVTENEMHDSLEKSSYVI